MSDTASGSLSPLRSVHTTNFPALLQEVGISLLVSTYQAGRLIVVRADGDVINTHFRTFHSPMGIAASADGFAVGSKGEIHEYANSTAVAKKIEPAGRHDACFLRRGTHVTGDIDIHEMTRSAQGELWFVNTRFSCLCTLDRKSSFVPRWRPPFVSALSPTDRCHLNGLAMRQGLPRYVTALGNSDDKEGWRANKAAGGVLIDPARAVRINIVGFASAFRPARYWPWRTSMVTGRRRWLSLAEMPSGKSSAWM